MTITNPITTSTHNPLAAQAERGHLRSLGKLLRDLINAVANISTTEIGWLDGVTAGTVTASKAVVVDSSKDIGHFRHISALGAGAVTSNAAFGATALTANTTGALNTVVGVAALDANTVGVRNNAFGNNALGANTTGTDNVAIGAGALDAATTAVENVAIGTDALGANTIGTFNVAIGDDALLALTTATSCIAIGRDALVAVTTGVDNTAIGDQAGSTITTGDGNTLLGNKAHAGSATAIDRIVLAAGAGSKSDEITADVAVFIGNNARTVRMDYGTDQTWDAPSDVRMKNLQRESPLGLAFILNLRPVEFKWKAPAEWPKEWNVGPNATMDTVSPILGMFAQDVKAALDKAGNPVFGGWSVLPSGQQQLGESAFVYPLIKAVQELAAQVAELKNRA